MSQSPVQSKRANPGFGNAYRGRRRSAANQQSSAPKDTKDMVAEFLKTKQVTRCPTRFADGARFTSGYYEF